MSKKKINAKIDSNLSTQFNYYCKKSERNREHEVEIALSWYLYLRTIQEFEEPGRAEAARRFLLSRLEIAV